VVVLNLALGQMNARLGLLIAQGCMALFSLLIWLGGGFPLICAYPLMGSYITARGLAIAQGRSLLQAANMGAGYGLLETVMSLRSCWTSVSRLPVFHSTRVDLRCQRGADPGGPGSEPAVFTGAQR